MNAFVTLFESVVIELFVPLSIFSPFKRKNTKFGVRNHEAMIQTTNIVSTHIAHSRRVKISTNALFFRHSFFYLSLTLTLIVAFAYKPAQVISFDVCVCVLCTHILSH